MPNIDSNFMKNFRVITLSFEDMRVRMKINNKTVIQHEWEQGPAFYCVCSVFSHLNEVTKSETNEYNGSKDCQARWGTEIGSPTTRWAQTWQTVQNHLLDSSQSCFSKCNLSQLHTAYAGWDCWIWARINETTDVCLVSFKQDLLHTLLRGTSDFSTAQSACKYRPLRSGSPLWAKQQEEINWWSRSWSWWKMKTLWSNIARRMIMMVDGLSYIHITIIKDHIGRQLIDYLKYTLIDCEIPIKKTIANTQHNDKNPTDYLSPSWCSPMLDYVSAISIAANSPP